MTIVIVIQTMLLQHGLNDDDDGLKRSDSLSIYPDLQNTRVSSDIY